VQAPDAGIRQLDPRSITLNRLVNALTSGVVAISHLVAAAALWLAGNGNGAAIVALAWVPAAAGLVWLSVRWPVIAYRHRRYRLDAVGLEIWSGVLFREAVSVPRSRVQHIDVSQGPFERSYGLATLSVYTAGTDHSKVDLPGLDHAVALAVRDSLLPTDADPAV
jgi:membrane protein YdbS with pleckstrin-like domain